MGFGGSHSPGGVLAFEAMAALYIFGVRPIEMRARVFVQKALHSVPGGGGWPGSLAVLGSSTTRVGLTALPRFWSHSPLFFLNVFI